ncbi:MAG: tetratricopeptide repeat protein [Notoacmeibacter sp.]
MSSRFGLIKLVLAASAVWLSPAFAAVSEPVAALPSTFAGSYLAGLTADADDDREDSIRFYNQALALSGDNLPVKQSLFLTLLSTGDLEKAKTLAEVLKDQPDIDRLARLLLGVSAIKNGQYAGVSQLLKTSQPSDLDRLIAGLISAWAIQGEGKTKEATALLDALSGPEWFLPFKQVHAALILEAAGQKDAAAKSYDIAFKNEASMQAAPDAYLRMVEAYAGFLARDGKNARAFEVLQKGQDLAPNRPMFETLRSAIMSGKAPAPLVSDAKQGTAEVLFTLGMAINRQGAEPFVERYLKMAADLAPNEDLIRYELGRLSERLGRNADAVTHFASIKKGAPLYRLAHLQQALNLTDLERNAEAITQLRSIITEDPSDVRAYLALGGIHSRAKDYRSAATLFSEAIEVVPVTNPDLWNLHYQRGIAHERLDEWEIAEPAFRKAMELKPNDADVLNYLGYSLIDKGLKLDEAVKMVEKAVELEPDSGFIIDSLGWAYFRLGRIEDAIVELERAIAIMPGDATINDHLGDAYWAVGRKSEARFQWNHALKGQPEQGERLKIQNKIGVALTEAAIARKAHLEAFEKARLAEEAAAKQKASVEVPAPDAGVKSEETKVANANPDAVLNGLFTVSAGQSLWTIAQSVLGDGNRFNEILALNPQLKSDPSRIFPGQELKLPQ